MGHSVFSKNRDRLLEGEIASKFLAARRETQSRGASRSGTERCPQPECRKQVENNSKIMARDFCMLLRMDDEKAWKRADPLRSVKLVENLRTKMRTHVGIIVRRPHAMGNSWRA